MVDAAEGHHRLAGIREHFAQPPHRPDDLRHQADEHEQLADGDAALGQERAADDEHDADLREAEQIAHAPVGGFEAVHVPELVAVGAVARAEARDLVFLAGEGAHHANAGEVLLQRRAQRTFGFVGQLEPTAHARKEQERPERQERHQAHAHRRQPRVAPKQQGRHHRHQQHGAPDLHHLRRQKQPHGFHVRTAPLHQVARVRGIEERRRQVVQPQEQGVAHRRANDSDATAAQRPRRYMKPAPTAMTSTATRAEATK